MAHQDLVDICIVTWNRLPLTRACIESVVAHTRHPHRIFVADNGSDDGTADYLRDLHARGVIHRLFLFEKNVGVAPASNTMWEASDAPFYLKLDNDIEVLREGWLGDMVRLHRDNPEAKLLAYSFQRQFYGVTYPIVELSGGGRAQDPRPHNIGGATVLVPQRTHEMLGFWCEDYAPYSDEDTDYSFRAVYDGLRPFYMERTDMLKHLYLKSTDQHDAGEYRTFKSSHRRRQKEEFSAFTINTLMYELQQRSLKMRRRFDSVVQSDGVTVRLSPNRDYYAKEMSRVRGFREELARGGRLAALVTAHQAQKLAIINSSSLQIAAQQV